MLPFSSSNPIGSSVFREPESPEYSSDRLGGSIWSSTPNSATQRPQAASLVGEHQGVWGSYGAAAQIPEYQPSWNYSQQHSMPMRESHSSWGGNDHDGWKYSRSQVPPPPPTGGVWQYPSSHQDYPEWGNRGQHSAPQQGYYYVPSGHHHDQRGPEEYIPYDIGSRRAYQMPPPPPGYPLPPHMQYYSPGIAPAPLSAPQVAVTGGADVPAPSGTPASTGKPGGAASFLFEAAAAAMAKNGSVEEKVLLPESNSEIKQENREEKESPSHHQTERGRGRAGKGNGAFAKPKSAPVTERPSRVNNHQLRLHASGNEKAPLNSGSSSGQITTLMIRNIPNRYTQTELMTELRESGFDNKFDFFYLPMDHETHANFGYAFINFVDEQDVGPFTKKFNGLKLNRFTSNKIIQIVPAQLQGFQANLQHYCKKAVCTDDNIDYRPLFFVDGKCLEFHRASEIAEKTATDEAPSPKVDSSRRDRQQSKGGFSKSYRGNYDRSSRH